MPENKLKKPSLAEREWSLKSDFSSEHSRNNAGESGLSSNSASNPIDAVEDFQFRDIDHKSQSNSQKPSALILHPSETNYFIFANFMDLMMTLILLRFSAVEANPIANYFLLRYGSTGMIAWKIVTVLIVVIIVQIVARLSPARAKMLLVGGTIFVSAVVVYSMFLARTQIYGSLF